MLVHDLMSKPVFTVPEDQHLRVVDEVVKWNHIRHAPVVDAGGRAVGIMSHRDLLAAAVSTLAIRISQVELAQHLGASQVRNLM